MPLNVEMKAMTDEKRLSKLDIDGVKARMVTIRGQMTLLNRDVAGLYGVATREINQAVRNNPGKFPEGYVVQMSESEFSDWRSKILISDLPDETKNGIRKGLRHRPFVFTERGLYMLATILKGERAVRTTLAIIETYAQVRDSPARWKPCRRSRMAARSSRPCSAARGKSLRTSSATTSRWRLRRRRSNSISQLSRFATKSSATGDNLMSTSSSRELEMKGMPITKQ